MIWEGLVFVLCVVDCGFDVVFVCVFWGERTYEIPFASSISTSVSQRHLLQNTMARDVLLCQSQNENQITVSSSGIKLGETRAWNTDFCVVFTG